MKNLDRCSDSGGGEKPHTHAQTHPQTHSHTLQSMRTRTPTQVRLSVINSQHASGAGTGFPKLSSGHGGAERLIPNHRSITALWQGRVCTEKKKKKKKKPREGPARNLIIQLRVVRQSTAECVTAERERERERERGREQWARLRKSGQLSLSLSLSLSRSRSHTYSRTQRFPSRCPSDSFPTRLLSHLMLHLSAPVKATELN